MHFVDHLAEPALEFTLHAGSGLKQADVQGQEPDALDRWWDVATDDSLGEPFDHRSLAHPGFTHQDRVVLASSKQDVDRLANLTVTADDGIQFTVAGLGGEIGGEPLERFLLAELGRGDRATAFTGHGLADRGRRGRVTGLR